MKKLAQEEVNPYFKNIAVAAAIGALLGAGSLSAAHLISGKEISEREALVQNLKAAAKGAVIGGGAMSVMSNIQLLDALRRTLAASENVPDLSVPDDIITYA